MQYTNNIFNVTYFDSNVHSKDKLRLSNFLVRESHVINDPNFVIFWQVYEKPTITAYWTLPLEVSM
jgi:hypothetical protein